jgi:hypothetical protein
LIQDTGQDGKGYPYEIMRIHTITSLPWRSGQP